MHEKKTHEGKKQALFECLDEADKSLNRIHTKESSNSSWRGEYRRRNQQNPSNEDFRSKYNKKDSIFKRPDMPISRCLPTRRLPDYEKNPHKWKKYTLADVSDTSDRMNTTAAFNFLRQVEEQKQKKQEKESNQKDQKVVFKKSVKLRPKNDELDPQLDGKKIQGNRIVMPEYVVGEKRKVPKSNRRPSHTETSSRPSKQLNLAHLNEDEDEDSME